MSARKTGSAAAGRPVAPRPAPLTALAAVLALEAAGLAVVLVLLAAGIATATRGVDLASAAALAVLALVGVLLLIALARGAWRASPWVLAAGTVWQVVQLLVGVAAFQGTGANPVLGTVVAVPAVAGLLLLFSRPVREALRRPDRGR